ncbi:hypothetical protein PAESOLCIP111_01142 [Paenibacillus solanacearum]|uniref:Glycoside hydrolase n=1 Tax=Paenibacillus solanacearum TaxID=2048548 RepID=A0A916NMW7_9BACL|nr:family 43 glycosylhydrolase [Paenibacillus solanacearum]CAG7609193.1 hypothetical protein PAESOLCIP111_01142 [Paenibacillus solanacearum]
MDNFLPNPPHPETEWSACTLYSENAMTIQAALDVPLTDASVCLGPDGWYYMTGTVRSTQEKSVHAGIPLWKSRNLKEWQQVPAVRSHSREAAAASSPEIHYLRGTFWITYSLEQGGTGLLKSVTGSIEGPYDELGMMTSDGTDASIFEDDDGAVYWLYQDGNIARMKDDLSGLAEEPRLLEAAAWKKWIRSDKASLTKDLRIGTHGAFMKKIDGLYYLFCAEPFNRMGCEGTDTFVAVSSHIYGPYSRRYLVIPHGGQATVFAGNDGTIYAAFSGCGAYSPVRSRPAILPLELAGRGFIRPDRGFILEEGAVAGLQPLGQFPLRDPHVYTGPDGTYYLTGTSDRPHTDFWNGNDELHIWSSGDLKEWKHLVKAWDLHIDGTWQNHIYDSPCLWAPEIIYVHDTFWLTYSLKGGSTGLLKSVSGKAEGPYIDMGRMTNTDIDSSLFQDDDGTVYFVWQNGKIARMKHNMTGFAEDSRQLLDADGIPVGYEGAFIVKYKGKYILGAAEWHGDERVDGTYDLMYAVSDHIYGPYSHRHVAVPHGGHGTMFVDRDGRLMCTLFGNDRTAPFRARLGIVALHMDIEADHVIIRPDEAVRLGGNART